LGTDFEKVSTSLLFGGVSSLETKHLIAALPRGAIITSNIFFISGCGAAQIDS
jgi:hypothetical protein